jgi:hypothetical protein
MDKKEYMLSQVEAWKQSGISQQTFCDKSGIKLGTFSYLIKISKQQDNLAGGFIELANPSIDMKSQYEIVYPNGVILKVQNTDLKEIFSLVNLH